MKDGIFKKEAKFMVGMYVLIPVVGIIAAIAIPFLKKNTACDNSIVSIYTSPDGSKKAILFARDCGATTDFSTQISILPSKEELPNEGGNVFVADSDHGKAATGQWGGPKVTVSWQNGNNILVNYADKTRIFKKQEQVEGVHVTYSEGISAANQKDTPDHKPVR
ncbi:hypothetical protein [Geomobilimonas luticola]|uniref:Uncharacterized protein n=1 Tax=Geomobilimonas luticola TaxID=1114878 RepID=A0ABS5SFF7_9BACT|nr:hypothetical protein [Geomobilimonas luticola]MBT0654099.1 hypothetical protein [Geomobilimonas luticola]